MSDALIRKIDELTTTIDEQAELIAALTEQRDAAVAALKRVQWYEWDCSEFVECPQCGRQHSIYKAPELRDHTEECEVAAAIAMTEGAKG